MIIVKIIIFIVIGIIVLTVIGAIVETGKGGVYTSPPPRTSKPPTPPFQPKTFDQMLGELADARDNVTARDASIDREMKKTAEVVRRVRTNARINLNLGIDELMSKVNSLVDYAEKISGNANPENFQKDSENFVYNEHLWYRARLAGIAFKEASELVQAKLNQLHKIDFGSISASDRQKIMQLQSPDGLVALKKALLDNAITMFNINKNIKELIRMHCGEGGRSWAEKMDKSAEEKHS